MSYASYRYLITVDSLGGNCHGHYFLQGSPELEEINGIQTGRLSGIVAHHIPNYLQKNLRWMGAEL